MIDGIIGIIICINKNIKFMKEINFVEFALVLTIIPLDIRKLPLNLKQINNNRLGQHNLLFS